MDSREIRRIIWQGVDIKKVKNRNAETWSCKQGGCDSCQSSCQTSCERSCQTGCQKSCQSTCEISYQRPCSGSQSPTPCGVAQGCGRIQGGGVQS